MSLSFRVLATVGVLTLVTVGCGQAKQPGATAKRGSGKAAAADSKAGSSKAGSSKAGSSKGAKAHGKTGDASARATGASARKGEKGAAAESARSGSRVSTLTAADDGRDLDLRLGQTLSVVLNASRSTGLTWVLVDPNGTVIVREGAPVYVAKRGGAGSETWHFRAARPGHQTVRLEYRRKWTQSVPERTFRFTATVR